MNATLLTQALRDPATTATLDPPGWNALIAMARAERLIGTLAHRLADQPVPPAVAPILSDAILDTAREARQALWEADRAAQALAPLGIPTILLKGTAYAAAGLSAGQGRFIGDLDILVPRDRLDEAEAALFAAGWEWVKPDPYDDAYYRRWMHELPPMIHATRDRMIDVHHTVLPLTARPKPDAAAMIADAIPITDGLYVLSPEDRLCHAAAHMLADGDLQGGLRNLWDMHCLLADAQAQDADFIPTLLDRAVHHGLTKAVRRALRLTHRLYGTQLRAYDSPIHIDHRPRKGDWLYAARLLARNGWGQEVRKPLVFAFFVRSHWLRMPPLMLARHLWTKWRKGHRPG